MLDANPETIPQWRDATRDFNDYENASENATSTTTGGSDTVHQFSIETPKVIGTFPGKDALNVSIKDTTVIVVSFNQSMSTETVKNAFSISPAVPGEFDLTNDKRLVYEIKNHPEQYLHYNTTYTVTMSALAKNLGGITLDGNKNGECEGSPTDDYVFKFTTEPPNFALKCWPMVAHIRRGETVNHNIQVNNNCVRDVFFNILAKTINSTQGWSISNLPDKVMYPIGANSSDLSTYSVTNNDAPYYLNVQVNVTALDSVAGGEFFGWGAVEHMSDHPDETYDVSDGRYPTDWLIDTESDIGILLTGWGDGIGHILGKEQSI